LSQGHREMIACLRQQSLAILAGREGNIIFHNQLGSQIAELHTSNYYTLASLCCNP
jgi:hypothetical protein